MIARLANNGRGDTIINIKIVLPDKRAHTTLGDLLKEFFAWLFGK